MITEDRLEQQCLLWFQDGGRDAIFGLNMVFANAIPLCFVSVSAEVLP